MTGYFSYLPLVAVLVSSLAAVFIVLFNNKPNIREAVTLIAAGSKLAIVLFMLPPVLNRHFPELTLLNISPGISLAFRVDEAGIIFALLASTLWFATSFYSIKYMRGLAEKYQARFFACFALCLSSTIGIAFSANLLTFYLFYELLTIATYPLVTHHGTPGAVKAGRKYLAYLVTGGVILLAAIVYTYQVAGTLDFTAGGLFGNSIDPQQLAILFSLFLVGFGFKSAIMPLHSWLPSAMVAPTPVSALLHAVAVVKAGVFGLVRAAGFVIGPEKMNEIGLSGVMAVLASVTIILASLLALRQDNLKARLAYSTIGHLSYIVLALSLFSIAGWTGGLMHIASHGVMKITLFFCAGAIYFKSHLVNISDLDGIGHRMPWTMGAFAIASIGLAGLPPVVGFVSKFLLVEGAIEVHQFWLAGVLLLSGLLNAAYFFPIVYRAFFKQSRRVLSFGEGPPLMVVPIVGVAVLSLILGIWPNALFHFFDLARAAASSIIGAG
jgi:multicomponent Na+:H+ antiporter subunit D